MEGIFTLLLVFGLITRPSIIQLAKTELERERKVFNGMIALEYIHPGRRIDFGLTHPAGEMVLNVQRN